MPDPAVAVAEATDTPVPLGELANLTDFRSRRSEADSPAAESPAEVAAAAEDVEPETPEVDASAAGKALAAKKGSLQARIDEITREKHATATERDTSKAEAAALRAELAALKAGKPAEAAPAKVEPTSAKPAVEQFGTLDEYFEALADWKIEQRDAKVAADAKVKAETTARETAQSSFEKAAQSWITRRDAFAATTPEFETVAMPFLQGLTAGTPIGDAIMDSEVGPQIALHLASHPEDAQRIAGLPWPAQIRAIGKIETQFDAPAEPAEKKAPPVSRAPAPVRVPASGAPESASQPDPSTITSVKTWRSVRKHY